MLCQSQPAQALKVDLFAAESLPGGAGDIHRHARGDITATQDMHNSAVEHAPQLPPATVEQAPPPLHTAAYGRTTVGGTFHTTTAGAGPRALSL